MQIILGAHTTVFKIPQGRNKIQQILKFIQTNFTHNMPNKNTIQIPFYTKEHDHRVFLVKWLYSLYRRSNNKALPDLKSALIERIEKPIELHLPPINLSLVKIIVTFYEEGICHLGIDCFNETCDRALKHYFSDYISVKSQTFNLYELSIQSSQEQDSLRFFLGHSISEKIDMNIKYNAQAFERFVAIIPAVNEIDKAYIILNVKKEDTFKRIKQNYKKLAKACHPDLLSFRTQGNIKQSTQSFQVLLDAFHLIKKHKMLA
ncbi:MAG: hypothetical protein COA44_14270 [Arcobacter sp.]|nr:MAG: hypothetical protein COA44_14270 [Arcobacter sp.]